MSYSSYSHLPYLDSHAEALYRFNNTTPIRGSNPVRYPLGRRGDSNKFGISKVTNADGGEDVVLSLYGFPLITFHPNTDNTNSNTGTLTIGDPTDKRQWRWSSCDSYFVHEVLWRYIKGVWTDRGRLVIEARDGQKFVLSPKTHMTFTYDKAAHTLTPTQTDKPLLYTYKLNRKATNNVRARYGEFYRYMKGMIGVRKQVREEKYTDWRNGGFIVDTSYVVNISDQEVLGVVPTKKQERTQYGGGKVTVTVRDDSHPMNDYSPKDKPARIAIQYEQINPDNNAPEINGESNYRQVEVTKHYDGWLAATQAFVSLISTPAHDPDQHEKFRQAFVWLAYFANGSPYQPGEFNVEVTDLQKCIDEIVFKYHSEEVIERVPAKPNTVPSGKYLKWITRERD